MADDTASITDTAEEHLSPPRGSRNFLFLQSMPTQYFSYLGRELLRRGCGVWRVNFNAGDLIFWRQPNGIQFRDGLEHWPAFLERLLERFFITDIILFGDCRAPHRAAITLAQRLHVTVHVCEEGYFRPGWVTFEEGGVNAYSTLPRDADWFHSVAENLPVHPRAVAVRSSFARRACEDLAYNVAALLFAPFFPRYISHRPRHRLLEYAGWSWKLIKRPLARRATRHAFRQLDPDTPCFLFPLQLDSDSQVRFHSSFPDMTAAVRAVVESFARHAPSDAVLMVKEHPLDERLTDWPRVVRQAAADAGAGGRVVYFHVGDIGPMIARAQGVVTVNSTAGLQALAAGVPVIVLGSAIYDIPGMTHQGGLDTFWAVPCAPEAALFDAFRRTLEARCLLAGDFFSRAGLDTLIANTVRRLLGATMNTGPRLVNEAENRPA